MASILDFADRNWPLLNKAARGHTAIYRATRGRVGWRVPGLRARMLLLDHKGAKSGTQRTSPLLYVEDGDDLVLIASKGGYPKNPAWFYNLRANPETTVQVGPEKRAVRARVASDEERERLWPKAVAAYADYETYQRRSKGRKIPMVILEPAGSAAS
jgi:deazaflavin-dependent oxidoreductase (nitroreductase family)